MNIFRFGDFGQTFLGLISCICWINDVNSLIDSSPSSPSPPHAFEYRPPLSHVKYEGDFHVIVDNL